MDCCKLNTSEIYTVKTQVTHIIISWTTLILWLSEFWVIFISSELFLTSWQKPAQKSPVAPLLYSHFTGCVWLIGWFTKCSMTAEFCDWFTELLPVFHEHCILLFPDFEAGVIRLLDKVTNGSNIVVNETGKLAWTNLFDNQKSIH